VGELEMSGSGFGGSKGYGRNLRKWVRASSQWWQSSRPASRPLLNCSRSPRTGSEFQISSKVCSGTLPSRMVQSMS